MGSKLFKAIIVVCLLTCVVILLQLCSSEPTPVIEDVIKPLKIQKDSIHERVVYKDRERIVYVTKWRTLKGRIDTIPCPLALEEVIVLTDSIIYTDSSEISSLKAELFVDALIIANQDTLIVQKDKEIRKQKRWKNFWKGTTIVAAGLNLLH